MANLDPVRLPWIEMVELFRALGVDTADQWPPERFREELGLPGGVNRFAADPEMRLAPELTATFVTLIRAARSGTPVEVVRTEGDATRAVSVKVERQKRARNGRPPKVSKDPAQGTRPRKGATDAEWRAWYAVNPLVPKPGSVVMNAVIRELRNAGANNIPISKRAIHAVLVREFPERDPNGMWTNVNILVPARLRDWYAIHVWRKKDPENPRGYVFWIAGDGSTPQPAGEDPA